IGPVCACSQICKITVAKPTKPTKLFTFEHPVQVSRFLQVSGGKPGESVEGKRLLLIREVDIFCMKVHYTAQGVAAVDHGAGAHNHLGSTQYVRVDIDDILQVSTAKNGVIHPHAIHYDQYGVGAKATNHGAA